MKTFFIVTLAISVALISCHKSPGVNQTGQDVQPSAGFDGSQENLIPGSRH